MPFDPYEPSPIHGLSDSSWPSNRQISAIGSVVLAWSWFQLGLENLMATLVQGDEMLVQSFTEDLSPDNRLKALRRLLTTWERIVPDLSDDHRAAFAKARDVIKWIARNKGRRNQIAHWIWVRVDDETLFGWKHHTMPTGGADDERGEKITVSDLQNFTRDIGNQEGVVAEIDRVLKSLSPWPQSAPSNEIPPVPGLASLLSPYRRRN